MVGIRTVHPHRADFYRSVPAIIDAKLGFLVGREKAFTGVHGDDLFDLFCQLNLLIWRQPMKADQRTNRSLGESLYMWEGRHNRKTKTRNFFGIFHQRIASLHMSKRSVSH
jgi:hypothetical protein